jgi:AcrR family transcriptional regulator
MDPQRPTDDPTAQLSPTARKLVAAARRLLARGGYEALTVEAVAAEAGAYRDSVRYYFGSKAPFLAAVVDSLSHDQSRSAVAETQAARSATRRRSPETSPCTRSSPPGSAWISATALRLWSWLSESTTAAMKAALLPK